MTEQELVEIYERYPRKGGGRKEGLALLGNEIKTRTQLEELRRAVDYYAREQRNTEKTFIKTFANWAASWEDYAQPDLSSTAPPQANPAMDSVAVMMRKDAEWKNLTDEERAAAEKEAKTAFAAAKAVLK